MHKSRIACLVALSFLASVFAAQAVYAQDCTPQFSISPESINISSGELAKASVTVTNTGSCEGSAMVYPVLPADWISGANFTTDILKPGESESSTIKIIPTSSDSVTVRFAIQGAGTSTPPVENIPETTQPPVNVTPALPIKNEPKDETPAPQAQQPAGGITGLVTGSPAVQSAVLVILILGGALVLQNRKNGGFKYRFRN